MSLKDELDKIIYSESGEHAAATRPQASAIGSQKDRLDEVRPLLKEFAEAVDEDYVRIRITDTRVVIDVGDRPSDADRFEIDGRWELEPNPEVRFLAEPGAEVLRPRSSFVVWKTFYLRPLMDPDYLSWDRKEFDSGVEAFQYIFQDVAKQIARHLRLKRAEGGLPEASPDVA